MRPGLVLSGLRPSGRVAFAAACVGLLGALAGGCVDAEREQQVTALGGEDPGVPPGPLHRPGQPCLVCHGAGGPSSTLFVLAGTVYAKQGESAPAVGANVIIEDSTSTFYSATTNSAGNFYITPDDWMPTLPAQASVQMGQTTQQMTTHIGRDGSCAGCHALKTGPTSPGPVYVIPADLPEGGL
jgi:hypothetical protein